MYNPYLESLREEIKRLENIHEDDITEFQQILLNELSKELELLTKDTK